MANDVSFPGLSFCEGDMSFKKKVEPALRYSSTLAKSRSGLEL